MRATADARAGAESGEPEPGPHGAFENKFWPTAKHASAKQPRRALPQASVHDVRIESGDLPGAARLVGDTRFGMRACYDRDLGYRPQDTGAVQLVLTIDRTGNVTDVQHSQRGELASVLVSCVAARMSMIRFRVRGSGPWKVSAAVTFSTEDAPAVPGAASSI